MAEALIARDPGFAEALLQEAVQRLLGNEIALARHLVRHAIRGTVGYTELSRRTGTPETSLVRMFGPKGNPTLANLFSVLDCLQRYAGVSLKVTADSRLPRRSRHVADAAA